MLLHRLHDGMGVLGNVPIATELCFPGWRVDMSITQNCRFFSSVKLHTYIDALNQGRTTGQMLVCCG